VLKLCERSSFALRILPTNLNRCYAADSQESVLILGQQHFDYLATEWLEHYHDERPHQSLNNETPERPKQRRRPKQHDPTDDQVEFFMEVSCSQRLGGLLQSYSRKAALCPHKGTPLVDLHHL
jgi:hypothetical protein